MLGTALASHGNGAVAARRVLSLLRMADSYVFSPATLSRYPEVAATLYKKRTLQLPLAMASCGADGSLVSTTQHQLRLLRAFMSGSLFPSSMLEYATPTWRHMFIPLTFRAIATMALAIR